MAKVDLRKLKEQALKAIEKQQWAKAAELYIQIAEAEPADPDWRQRAGEALRKVPDKARAAAELMVAAEGYAKNGFLLKAIAVCKVVLQIDPSHTSTQAMLAELYAKREGTTPSGKIAVVPQVDLARTSSGQFAIVNKPQPQPPPQSPPLPPPLRASPRPPAPPLPPIPPPPEPLPSPLRDAPLGLSPIEANVVAIDDRPAPLIDPTAPLDTLPLHAFLGGKKSGQFSLDDIHAGEQPSAYEISLDEELSLADAIPSDEPSNMKQMPVAPPLQAPPSSDEMDFSGLLDDAPPSSLPPPAAPPPSLPKIPLLSSLAMADLREVIERVQVREFEPRDVVMRQGEEGGSLFIIVSGKVEVALEGPPPRTLATLGEGAFFGELGLITNFPRSATVTALEPLQTLEISRELVLDIVARSPEILKTLLRFFRDRLLDRLLGESQLFASLPADEARRLAERFVFLELDPGVRAVAEGERSPGLFLLLCGVVDVVRGGGALASLGPGDVFGEMSLLERKPAGASIVTRTKCWALELPRSDFQEIMLTYPALLEYVSALAETRKQAPGDSRVEFL